MASQFLEDALIRHQTYLQGFATHTANMFDPFLIKADRIIRDVLSSVGDTISTQKELTEIIRQLRKELTANYSAWGDELIESLEELTETEVNFTTKALGQATNVEVNKPTISQTWAAINVRPIQINDKGESKLMQPLINEFTPNEVNRVNSVVRLGFFEGQTTQQIITRIRGTKKNQFKDGVLITTDRNAEAIARTSVNHVSNVARQSTYNANQDILKGWRFSATLDNRTSSQCRFFDDQVFKMGEGPVPPLHLNCVTGDTSVSSSGPINSIYRRRYKGVAINITTKAGRTLCITPNHPVLTSTGWKAAKLLNAGDKLVCINGVVHSDDKYSVKSNFSYLFSSLNVSRNSSFIANRPTASEDFHGDASDGEVNIINVNSLARDCPEVLNHIENYRLDTGSTIDEAFSGFSALKKLFSGWLPSFGGLVGICRKSLNLLRSGVIHSCLLLLASISSLNAKFFKGVIYSGDTNSKSFMNSSYSDTGVKKVGSVINKVFRNLNKWLASRNSISPQDSIDWLVSHADSLGDMCDRHLIDSSHFDDITDLSFSEIDTHVYNLESGNNWYIANGIVTHNCRSSSIPELKDKFDIFGDSGTRASKGAKGGQQTNAKDYYEWLGRQPKWFQQDVLGKAQTELFRKGGLTNDQFRKLVNNKFGQPLTLDEIRRKDPQAFEQAGLD